MHLNIHTSKNKINNYNINCKSFSPTTTTKGTITELCSNKMLDFNSYYAYHSNNLSYMETEEEDVEEKIAMSHINIRNGNDTIIYSASDSLSHSLSLGSVNEKSSQSNPTTAAEDNNCTLRISSCKPLKFPLASEWLV